VFWGLRGLGFDWLLTFNRKIDVMQLVLQLNRLMIVQQKQKQERCAKRALYSQQELFMVLVDGGLSWLGCGMTVAHVEVSLFVQGESHTGESS